MAMLVITRGHKYFLVGGFNPSEKYESQLGWLFPIYIYMESHKIHVPNHQPVISKSHIKQELPAAP
jgi:hypothetical protein